MVVVFTCDISFCLRICMVGTDVLPRGFVGRLQCTMSGLDLCLAPHFRVFLSAPVHGSCCVSALIGGLSTVKWYVAVALIIWKGKESVPKQVKF